MASTLRGLALVLVLLPLAAGCYLPVPADPTAIAQGREVRVVLTEGGVARLRGRVDPRLARELQGELMDVDPDSLTLAMRFGDEFRGTALASARQPITVSRLDIEQVTTRRLHRERTAVAVAAAAVALAVLVAGMVDFGGSDTAPLPQPPDDTPLAAPDGWWAPAAPGRLQPPGG